MYMRAAGQLCVVVCAVMHLLVVDRERNAPFGCHTRYFNRTLSRSDLKEKTLTALLRWYRELWWR